MISALDSIRNRITSFEVAHCVHILAQEIKTRKKYLKFVLLLTAKFLDVRICQQSWYLVDNLYKCTDAKHRSLKFMTCEVKKYLKSIKTFEFKISTSN